MRKGNRNCRLAHCAAALVICTLLASTSRAAFTAGVERFDGTVKDLATWEEMAIFDGSSISQNDALFMHAPYAADFTTRELKIGLNQGFSAEMTMLSSEPGFTGDAWVALTTNSRGTTAHMNLDSHVLAAEFNVFYESIFAFDIANGDGTGSVITDQLPGIYDTTYVLSIFRASPTSATFSAATLAGQSLGSTTLTISGVPDDLFIGLYAQNGDVKFDNVRLFPEPSIAGVSVMFVAMRRRRSRAAP
jgi:hypothetical protein